LSSLALTSRAGLLLLLLAVPLIVLYILRVRRRKVSVGSTWLWAAAQRDLMAKSPFKRLLLQVPLLLQLALLAALAIALAKPARLAEGAFGEHIAVVIDVSASMSTQQAGDAATRLASAKAAALELVNGLAPGAQIMIVEAAHEPRIASPLDRDRARVDRAIRNVEQQEVVGNLSGAIALAVDRLKEFEDGRVVVFTDGYLAEPPELAKAKTPIEFILVGKPENNTAIVRVDARVYAEANRDLTEVFVLLANYGTESREAFVTVRMDGEESPRDSRRLMLPPGDRTPVVLVFEASPAEAGRALVVDVSPHDAMPVDDVVFSKVPFGEELEVWYLTKAPTEESIWAIRAFSADPKVRLKKGVLGSNDQSIPSDALVIVDGACPPADFPGGDLLVLNPGPGPCLGLNAKPPVKEPVITSWETGDARLRFVSLDRLHISEATPLEGGAHITELARADDNVIIRDASTPGRSATVVGFNVGESDWPLKASWVLFCRNIAEQARIHRTASTSTTLVAGEPLRVSVPGGTVTVEAKGPTGEALDVSLRSGLAVIPRSGKVGLYRLAYSGRMAGTLAIPLNLTSETESNLGALANIPTSDQVSTRTSDDAPKRFLEFGWLLAALGLVILLFELWYHTRNAQPVGDKVTLPTGKVQVR
jgi:hypothetical protein